MFKQNTLIVLLLLSVIVIGCQTAEPEIVTVEVTRIVEVPIESEEPLKEMKELIEFRKNNLKKNP